MEHRTAIVFGGTGLVGRALIEELQGADNYECIKVFVRNRTGLTVSGKIREFLTDFDHPESYKMDITGDDLFICLGTTIKKAGSVGRMEEIDRDLPVWIAQEAAQNSVQKLAVVSSVGAKIDSSNYYLRIKGEMEKRILEMNFETIAILRPSILLGKRKERRAGEKAGIIFMKIFGMFLVGKLLKYRGIQARDVAKAMIRILRDYNGKKIFESDQLQKIVRMN